MNTATVTADVNKMATVSLEGKENVLGEFEVLFLIFTQLGF